LGKASSVPMMHLDPTELCPGLNVNELHAFYDKHKIDRVLLGSLFQPQLVWVDTVDVSQ